MRTAQQRARLLCKMRLAAAAEGWQQNVEASLRIFDGEGAALMMRARRFSHHLTQRVTRLEPVLGHLDT